MQQLILNLAYEINDLTFVSINLHDAKILSLLIFTSPLFLISGLALKTSLKK